MTSLRPENDATGGPELPGEPAARCAALVDQFGRHPAAELGIDLDGPDDEALGRWLIACVLLDPRAEPDAARAAYRAIERAGLASPAGLGSAGAEAISRLLQAADYPRAEGAGRVLARAARSLCERWDGALSRLAGESLDLEELGGSLVRLAPGFGRAAVLRFLRPLRDHWVAAGELPLDPAAESAAIHLDLLEATRARGGDARPARRDLEWALECIGRRSCLRERASRCPLQQACPVRASAA